MRVVWTLFAGLLISVPAFSTITAKITPSVTSPQLVGTSITWTVLASDTAPGTLDYQFSVSSGGASQVFIDYSLVNTFVWVPSVSEGTYTVQVIVRNKAAGESLTLQAPFVITSRVTNGLPVISATANPLVALYSAPACAVGSQIYVVFGASATIFNHTNTLPCSSGLSMNFYIAGMLPNTLYKMYYVVITGSKSAQGPARQFTTGVPPAQLAFPATKVLIPAGAHTATTQSVLLLDNSAITNFFFPVATDLNGTVIWYYPALAAPSQDFDFFIRPVAGGTMILHAADPSMPSPQRDGQIWREIDLAGNTLRETNATRITEQLEAAGALGIIDFNHDSVRLPNGHTLILASQEEIFPAGTQGSPGPIDIIGDTIVDVDSNLQLAWWWSSFDHLNINRAAVLGETCTLSQYGCPPIALAPIAADWLHGNSLNYIPSSGDILLSMRNQDWVAKIDYNNGTGAGTVLWEMGPEGSFTFDSTDPYPWFSHQHDVEYELNGTTVLSVFDNGNTRHVENPGKTENSRGMVLNVNEPALTVTSILSQDLGVYSQAVGSAQRLDNGDYHFYAGFFTPSLVFEYGLTGTRTFELSDATIGYRTYRMDSLYQLDGPGN